jgi:hypothetical protein
MNNENITFQLMKNCFRAYLNYVETYCCTQKFMVPEQNEKCERNKVLSYHNL